MKEGGINVITCPKTIDNDVYGTEICFGYDTGMTIAAEAIHRWHTTASSHHRLLCTLLGTKAAELVLARDFGKMVAVRGDKRVGVELKEIVGKKRLVPLDHPLLVSTPGRGPKPINALKNPNIT